MKTTLREFRSLIRKIVKEEITRDSLTDADAKTVIEKLIELYKGVVDGKVYAQGETIRYHSESMDQADLDKRGGRQRPTGQYGHEKPEIWDHLPQIQERVAQKLISSGFSKVDSDSDNAGQLLQNSNVLVRLPYQPSADRNVSDEWIAKVSRRH